MATTNPVLHASISSSSQPTNPASASHSNSIQMNSLAPWTPGAILNSQANLSPSSSSANQTTPVANQSQPNQNLHYAVPPSNHIALTIDGDCEEQNAWKFKGYPDFAHWMNSSPDFLVLRRFGELNTRVLLAMQCKIAAKEKIIKKLDSSAKEAWLDKYDMGTWHNSRNDSLIYDAMHGSTRTALLVEVQQLLKEYNEYFLAYSTIKARRTADEPQVTNVKNWLKNHPKAIVGEEAEFIEHRGDLISIIPRQKILMRRLIEKWRFLRLSRMFKTHIWSDHHVDDPSVHYTSEQGFEAFVNACILGIGLVLLYGPLWGLNFVFDDISRLAIITGCTFLFTLMLFIATSGSRSFEVLAGTAAYAAVLMVFMQMSDPRKLSATHT